MGNLICALAPAGRTANTARKGQDESEHISAHKSGASDSTLHDDANALSSTLTRPGVHEHPRAQQPQSFQKKKYFFQVLPATCQQIPGTGPKIDSPKNENEFDFRKFFFRG